MRWSPTSGLAGVLRSRRVLIGANVDPEEERGKQSMRPLIPEISLRTIRRPRQLVSRLAACALLVVTSAACTPRARIRDPGEDSLVGDTRAGAEVYRNVIDQALTELSGKYRAQQRGTALTRRIRVAFMGVDNATNEELGSWRDQINDIINLSVNNSADFIDISYERFVKPAISEVGVSRDKLFLPANRRKLATILEQSGNPIDALLFGKLTQGDTRAGNLKQSDYLLTMELMNVEDGTRLMSVGEISKEYAR